MLFKRLAVGITACSLLVGLGLAAPAQAKRFSLAGGTPTTGSGAQFHIGNGLALPIQAAATAGMTKTVFPPLLVPVKGVPVVLGTTSNPLLTAMATSMGPVTKSGYQRKIQVPAAALSKPAVQKTVGVKFSNPTLYAVATNLNYRWPAAPAVFSTGAAVGTAVVAGFGGTMTYSNTLGARFGGPASGIIAPGSEPAGLMSTAPVTLYAKPAGAATPPCTHNAFGGTSPGCVAAILLAKPTGLGGIGGATAMTVMTPGAVIIGKNVAIMKMGAVPLGTVILKALAATNPLVPTNMATSQPGPWTTGRVIISNPGAAGGGEKFTLSGKDSRTAGGNGTITLVSGALSQRVASGKNANRGWLRLVLGAAPAAAVPSMSLGGIAATVGLIALGAGYALRRKLFA